jgi:hypothetical protein
MSGVGIVIGEQCPYCTKFRSRLDFIRQPGGVKICVECEQRHLEALDAISTGNFLGQCSECGLKAAELRVQKRCGTRGEMAVHFENGKYRAMCLPCNRVYVPKRRELYGGTEFGHTLNLT